MSAYAAAGWSFLFAAISFYWAMGGTTGSETLGAVFSDPAVINDPRFIAFVWVTAVLKAVAGLLALALIQPWGRRFPRRLLQLLVRGIGILLTLYGAALLIEHGLMVAGARAVPAALGSVTAARWHLLLWDPYWLLGGLLFLAAAKSASAPSLARHPRL